MRKTSSQLSDQVLSKVAFNLAQARKAVKATVSPFYRRGGLYAHNGKVYPTSSRRTLQQHGGEEVLATAAPWETASGVPFITGGSGGLRRQTGRPELENIYKEMLGHQEVFQKQVKQLAHKDLDVGQRGLIGRAWDVVSGKRSTRDVNRLIAEEQEKFIKEQLPKLRRSIEAAPTKFSPVESELVNRIGLLHEARELAAMRRPSAQIWKTREVAGHMSPRVLLDEHNMITTLAPRYKKVKEYFRSMRRDHTPDPQIFKKVQEVEPSFVYGESGRLSRHKKDKIMSVLRKQLEWVD